MKKERSVKFTSPHLKYQTTLVKQQNPLVMKKQMKTNLFTAALGLALFGVMLSSSTKNGTATTAHQATTWQGLPSSAPATADQASIPFTVYLSLVTAFTDGQSIDFNAMSEEGQSSIWDKMTNWREKQ